MTYTIIAFGLSVLLSYALGYWMAHRAQGHQLAEAWRRFGELRAAYQNLWVKYRNQP